MINMHHLKFLQPFKKWLYQKYVVSGVCIYNIHANLWTRFHFDQTDHLYFYDKTEDSKNIYVIRFFLKIAVY